MANLKAIRRRIKSVQATQKITRAMKMVAAAKVRRAQLKMLAARPFTRAVVQMIKDALVELAPVDLQEMPLLHRRPIKKVGLVVLTSDRGLCGSYNTNVVRTVLKRVEELKSEGKQAAVLVAGMKGVAFFKSVKIEKLKNAEGKDGYVFLPAVPTVEEAKMIARRAADLYVDGTVDAVELIGTDFINMIRSQVLITKFLPVELPERPTGDVSAEKLFEPSIVEVMQDHLLPKYIENVVYQALLEASTSELAARMNAMTNASNNARDLIASLTLIYNKARQSNITQDLLEIVGGAEALKG